MVEIYKKTFEGPNKWQILSILKKEGKIEQVNSLKLGTGLVDIITEFDYYLTLIDIFLLSKHFGISCVIIYGTKLPLFVKEFISFIDEKNTYSYYIYGSKFKKSNGTTAPIYGLLRKNGNIQISNTLMGNDYDILKRNNISNIEEFVNNVEKIKMKKSGKILKIKSTHNKLISKANSITKANTIKIKKVGKLKIKKIGKLKIKLGGIRV